MNTTLSVSKFEQISKKKSVTATTTAFCIDPSDIAELSSQVWLSDRHIDAGLILIKERFPNVGGLRSTFDAVVIAKTEKKYVQIHHIDLNHWITSAFVNGAIMVRYCYQLFYVIHKLVFFLFISTDL